MQETWDQICADVHQLGFGEPIPVSAEHGDGLIDIYDALVPHAVVDAPDAQGPEAGARFPPNFARPRFQGVSSSL